MWKVFGIQQAALRSRRGMTQPELAAATPSGYSASLVQKVEAGTKKPKPAYITEVDQVLGAQGVLVALMDEIQGERVYPHFFAEYADTEKRVTRLYKYDALGINGLLQTEEHARVVLSSYVPVMEEDEIEEHVHGRIDRQALLTRKPAPTLCFVIEEHILRRPIGGQEVHREQLLHITTCARMRHVSIHVMPTRVDAHVGLDGSMTLLDTDTGRSLAYVEWQGSSAFYSQPEEVGPMEQRYAMIRSQALPARESLELIEKLAGEL
jgi:transcriptional regulator with XRE-family HTH domain